MEDEARNSVSKETSCTSPPVNHCPYSQDSSGTITAPYPQIADPVLTRTANGPSTEYRSCPDCPPLPLGLNGIRQHPVRHNTQRSWSDKTVLDLEFASDGAINDLIDMVKYFKVRRSEDELWTFLDAFRYRFPPASGWIWPLLDQFRSQRGEAVVAILLHCPRHDQHLSMMEDDQCFTNQFAVGLASCVRERTGLGILLLDYRKQCHRNKEDTRCIPITSPKEQSILSLATTIEVLIAANVFGIQIHSTIGFSRSVTAPQNGLDLFPRNIMGRIYSIGWHPRILATGQIRLRHWNPVAMQLMIATMVPILVGIEERIYETFFRLSAQSHWAMLKSWYQQCHWPRLRQLFSPQPLGPSKSGTALSFKRDNIRMDMPFNPFHISQENKAAPLTRGNKGFQEHGLVPLIPVPGSAHYSITTKISSPISHLSALPEISIITSGSFISRPTLPSLPSKPQQLPASTERTSLLPQKGIADSPLLQYLRSAIKQLPKLTERSISQYLSALASVVQEGYSHHPEDALTLDRALPKPMQWLLIEDFNEQQTALSEEQRASRALMLRSAESKARVAQYIKTPKAKATRRRWLRSSKGHAIRKAACRKYSHSIKGQQSQARYLGKESVRQQRREYAQAYRKSDGGHLTAARRNLRRKSERRLAHAVKDNTEVEATNSSLEPLFAFEFPMALNEELSNDVEEDMDPEVPTLTDLLLCDGGLVPVVAHLDKSRSSNMEPLDLKEPSQVDVSRLRARERSARFRKSKKGKLAAIKRNAWKREQRRAAKNAQISLENAGAITTPQVAQHSGTTAPDTAAPGVAAPRSYTEQTISDHIPPTKETQTFTGLTVPSSPPDPQLSKDNTVASNLLPTSMSTSSKPQGATSTSGMPLAALSMVPGDSIQTAEEQLAKRRASQRERSAKYRNSDKGKRLIAARQADMTARRRVIRQAKQVQPKESINTTVKPSSQLPGDDIVARQLASEAKYRKSEKGRIAAKKASQKRTEERRERREGKEK